MTTFILTHKEREVSPISILISYMGRKYKRPIGESVEVAKWNARSRRARIKAGDEDAVILNKRLDAWQEAGNRTINFFKDHGIMPAQPEFFQRLERERFGRDRSDDTILASYFDTFINRYKDIRSANRIKQYRLVQNVIKRFEQSTNCTTRFDDVDMDFHSRFMGWFYRRGYSPNYLGDCLKIIRTVMREADEIDGLHSNRIIYSKLFTVPKVKTDSIYLTEDELISIYRLKISDNSVAAISENGLPLHKIQSRRRALEQARDLFILGAFTGLRFSDYSKLTKDDIIDGSFVKYNEKTDLKTVIPVHWVIKEMLDNGFDFSAKIPEQKLNKHIKLVARLAGLDDDVTITRLQGNKRITEVKKKYELVTSHTARRSFATNAYLAGIPTIAIMKITGHKRESTFMEYIKVSETENAERLKKMQFFSGPLGVPNGVPNDLMRIEPPQNNRQLRTQNDAFFNDKKEIIK